MRAGSLRDKVQFQARLVTRPNGQMTITWSEEESDGAFCEFTDVQRLSETEARFVIRYRSNVKPDTHRIVFEDTMWNITSAVPDQRRTILTLDCDSTESIEVTHLQSDKREYLHGTPVIRTRTS